MNEMDSTPREEAGREAPTKVLGPAFAAVMGRELGRVEEEVRAFSREEELWHVPAGVRNSAGTLALHLAGNLEHFVGAVLGGTGYVRDREEEFGARDLPAHEVIRRIRACRERVVATLEGMDDAFLLAPYPGRMPPFMAPGAPAAAFLTHLTWHLGWHLGQMNYVRRITAGG
ncbi:MAG: DinB family protein [Gemmatimonadota bacterium]